MKTSDQRRIISYEFTIEDLLRLLVETGVIYASPANTMFRSEKNEPLRELPDDVRIINVSVSDQVAGTVRFSLESDNLPEETKYKGYLAFRKLEMDAPLGLASGAMTAVRATVEEEVNRLDGAEPITVN